MSKVKEVMTQWGVKEEKADIKSLNVFINNDFFSGTLPDMTIIENAIH